MSASPSNPNADTRRASRAVGDIDTNWLRKNLQDLICGNHVHDMRNVLPQILKVVIENELWRTYSRADGTPFTSLADFLLAGYPYGAGCERHSNALSYAQLIAMCEDFPSVTDVLAESGSDPLAELKSDWSKATATERHEFLAFLEADATEPDAPIPTGQLAPTKKAKK